MKENTGLRVQGGKEVKESTGVRAQKKEKAERESEFIVSLS